MPRNLLLYGAAVIGGIILYGVLRAVLGDWIFVLALIGLITAGVIVYRNLQTNRKVAEATPQQRAEALAFAPVAGKAALYIYRNQFVGRAVGINVLIDGREVAQLKSPRFTRVLLTPGAHTIAGFTGTNKPPAAGEGLAFAANAGDVTILKVEVEPQMVGVTVRFSHQPLEKARADLAKISRMVLADVAEI